MKTAIKGLALASLVLMSSGSAFAGVTVRFAQPQNYSDLPFASWDRKQVLDDLTEHFQKLAETLPPGVDLNVEVLDIDLAGRIHHRRANEIRVLRGGADWPIIHLRYSVTQNGEVVASGDERLRDMMYLDTLRNRYSTGDPLRYEKHMIDEWFSKKIAPKRIG
ncbi:DUF3016 domain-containing protein [Massilia sp. RP-1-19]|uniref:DUF3016 domain-containing protein n=1 Tax=Massilia polaris TaxID=2728846 RepID=A0A848HP06_9BURK|nr:DUF3016 domain-containing protein [Massilia polaris]NML62737.1 DUF3016 domain-containing protein [Massilia polaris]